MHVACIEPCHILRLPLDSRRASSTPAHHTLDISVVTHVANLIRCPARRVVALKSVVSRQARRVPLEIGVELVYKLVFAEVVISNTVSALDQRGGHIHTITYSCSPACAPSPTSVAFFCLFNQDTMLAVCSCRVGKIT